MGLLQSDSDTSSSETSPTLRSPADPPPTFSHWSLDRKMPHSDGHNGAYRDSMEQELSSLLSDELESRSQDGATSSRRADFPYDGMLRSLSPGSSPLREGNGREASSGSLTDQLGASPSGLWAWVPRRVPRIVGRGIIPQAFDASGPLVEGVTIPRAPASLLEKLKALIWRRKRGRWDALSHPLVRPLAQLPAESFVGLLFWTSLSNFLRCLYWLQLQAGGPTWQLLFLSYLFIPGFVLGQEWLRQGLARNPMLRVLLIAGGVVGIGGSSEGVPMTAWTLSLAGAAAAMLSLFVAEALWTTSAARRRRAGFGMAGGLLLLQLQGAAATEARHTPARQLYVLPVLVSLLQVLQFSFAGRNPLLARSWALVLLGVIPGAWVAALILYEDLAGWEASEMEDRGAKGGGGNFELLYPKEGRGEEEEEEEEETRLLGDLDAGSAVLSDDWDNDSLDERKAVLMTASPTFGPIKGVGGGGGGSGRMRGTAVSPVASLSALSPPSLGLGGIQEEEHPAGTPGANHTAGNSFFLPFNSQAVLENASRTLRAVFSPERSQPRASAGQPLSGARGLLPGAESWASWASWASMEVKEEGQSNTDSAPKFTIGSPEGAVGAAETAAELSTSERGGVVEGLAGKREQFKLEKVEGSSSLQTVVSIGYSESIGALAISADGRSAAVVTGELRKEIDIVTTRSNSEGANGGVSSSQFGSVSSSQVDGSILLLDGSEGLTVQGGWVVPVEEAVEEGSGRDMPWVTGLLGGFMETSRPGGGTENVPGGSQTSSPPGAVNSAVAHNKFGQEVTALYSLSPGTVNGAAGADFQVGSSVRQEGEDPLTAGTSCSSPLRAQDVMAEIESAAASPAGGGEHAAQAGRNVDGIGATEATIPTGLTSEAGVPPEDSRARGERPEVSSVLEEEQKLERDGGVAENMEERQGTQPSNEDAGGQGERAERVEGSLREGVWSAMDVKLGRDSYNQGAAVREGGKYYSFRKETEMRRRNASAPTSACGSPMVRHREDTDNEVLPFRQRRLQWTKEGCLRTCQVAVGYGSLVFFSQWLLGSPSVPPRWTLAPAVWGWVSIVGLALGIPLATEVARSMLPRRRQGVVALGVATLGCLWLLSAGPYQRGAYVRSGGDNHVIREPGANLEWVRATEGGLAFSPFLRNVVGGVEGKGEREGERDGDSGAQRNESRNETESGGVKDAVDSESFDRVETAGTAKAPGFGGSSAPSPLEKEDESRISSPFKEQIGAAPPLGMEGQPDMEGRTQEDKQEEQVDLGANTTAPAPAPTTKAKASPKGRKTLSGDSQTAAFATSQQQPTKGAPPPLPWSSFARDALSREGDPPFFRWFLLGAPLVSLAGPSLWLVTARNMFGVYPGLGMTLATLWYCFLLVWNTGLVAYESLGAASLLRASLPLLVVVLLAGIGWGGVTRLPDVSAEERRDFGLRSQGLWRTGRLQWGSGVPDRTSVLGLWLLCLSLLLLPILLRQGYSPSFSFSPKQEAGDLRLLNFNVQQGFSRTGASNFDAVRGVLKDLHPHVITLQETDTLHLFHGNVDMVGKKSEKPLASIAILLLFAMLSNVLHIVAIFFRKGNCFRAIIYYGTCPHATAYAFQVDYLSIWLGMDSLYSPPVRLHSWGCAILSRFPILRSYSEVLPTPSGERACFQYVLLDAGGAPLHVANAHFGISEGDIRVQANQTAMFMRWLIMQGGRAPPQCAEGDCTGGPKIILGGDFNAAPFSPAYNLLVASGLVDAHTEAVGEWKGPGDRDPGAGYVLASRTLRCVNWQEPRYDQRKTSDGFPVVASFNWTWGQ